MKKRLVTLEQIEGWPLIQPRKVLVVPVGLPCSGVSTLSQGLERLKFSRFGPEAVDHIRSHGRMMRHGATGFFPSLTNTQWEQLLGGLSGEVQKGASIVFDAPVVDRQTRDLLTSVATWWGYLVVRLFINAPADTCLARMIERDRLSSENSEKNQTLFGEIASRLAHGPDKPRGQEGHWLILDPVLPFEDLFELISVS